MKMKRITAALLSVVMLFGSFAFLMPVSAAEPTTEEIKPAFLDYVTATTEALENRTYSSAQTYLDERGSIPRYSPASQKCQVFH